MKKMMRIALAKVAFAATVSFVIAGGSQRVQASEPNTLPGYEIAAAVRAVGFDPIDEPIRGGSYYMLHAYDPYGIEMRVMVDAQFGGVLSVAPVNAINDAYATRYDRGPRIIQVPQTDE